jgi:hypothetical protein
MAHDGTINEALVRGRALEAARWLALTRFRGRPTGPVFSPLISTYADMFDPDAELPRLLEACRGMREQVARQIVVEQIVAEEIWAGRDRIDDPYRLAWRKSERGALLEMVARILDDALTAGR